MRKRQDPKPCIFSLETKGGRGGRGLEKLGQRWEHVSSNNILKGLPEVDPLWCMLSIWDRQPPNVRTENDYHVAARVHTHPCTHT